MYIKNSLYLLFLKFVLLELFFYILFNIINFRFILKIYKKGIRFKL